MNVNGLQVQLQRGPAEDWLVTLVEDLQVQMEEGERKGLTIRFFNFEEIRRLAGMLGVNVEGVFPTLAGKIALGLNFGFDERELTFNAWR